MSISLSKEAKTKVSLSNEDKPSSMTWDDSDPTTWDDDPGTWDSPRRVLIKESKSKVSLSNESKN